MKTVALIISVVVIPVIFVGSIFIKNKLMNQIKMWTILMTSGFLIAVNVLAIKNPDKFGRNIVQMTAMLSTSVIALSKQSDELPNKP